MALVELLGYAGIILADKAFTAVSMLIALVLGLLWHVVILPEAVNLHNMLNRRIGKNEGFMKNTIIEQMLDDGKAHYLIAYKGDKIIASGWITTSLAYEKSFLLSPSPEWEEWFWNITLRTDILYIGVKIVTTKNILLLMKCLAIAKNDFKALS